MHPMDFYERVAASQAFDEYQTVGGTLCIMIG